MNDLIRETCGLLSFVESLTFVNKHNWNDPDIKNSNTIPVYVGGIVPPPTRGLDSFHISAVKGSWYLKNHKNEYVYITPPQKYDENKIINKILKTSNHFCRVLDNRRRSGIPEVSNLFIDIPEWTDKNDKYRTVTEEEISKYPYSITFSEKFDPRIKSDLWIIEEVEECNFDYIFKMNKYTICSNKLFTSFFIREQLQKLNVVVMSLLKNTERRQTIMSQLEKLYIPYSFYHAVSGKEVHLGIFNPNIKMTNNQVQVVYRQNIYLHDKSKRLLKMSYGEFGCALSHLTLYDKFKESNEDACYIFEDDAFIEDPIEFITQIRYLPPFKTIDLVYMQNEAVWYAPVSAYSINDYYAVNNVRGVNKTHAYIVTKQGVNKMIKKDTVKCVNVPSDNYLNDLIVEGVINSVSPYRRVVGTKQSESDIWNIYMKNEKYTNVRWDKPVYPPCSIVSEDIGDWS